MKTNNIIKFRFVSAIAEHTHTPRGIDYKIQIGDDRKLSPTESQTRERVYLTSKLKYDSKCGRHFVVRTLFEKVPAQTQKNGAS